MHDINPRRLNRRFGGSSETSSDYFEKAASANASGDDTLALHLYLAAFEQATAEGGDANEEAINALKKAWRLACKTKQRPLAEYIFEKLDPYLDETESRRCVNDLQDMTLDKLTEYGFSRDELESVAESIGAEIAAGDARIVKVEHLTAKVPSKNGVSSESKDGAEGLGKKIAEKKPAADDGNADALGSQAAGALRRIAEDLGFYSEDDSRDREMHPHLEDLVGFRAGVEQVRRLGVCERESADFRNLVNMLNARHGYEGLPPADTVVFQGSCREDANRLMLATAESIGKPIIRMRMEDGPQGLPVICVMAGENKSAPQRRSLASMKNGGVLVLEDLDTWLSPFAQPQEPEDMAAFVCAQLSRGAREALELLHEAYENPDVFLLASVAPACTIDPFYASIIEGGAVVTVDLPTPEERAEMWMQFAHDHPSMRVVNRVDLVRWSANLSRFDIFTAAHEALDEAYRIGMANKRYVPLTPAMLFERLASFQPIDSPEYEDLEYAVMSEFRNDLEHIDDLLDE